MDDGSVFSHCLINSNTDLQVLLFCVELTYDNYNKSTSYPAIQQLVFAADRYRLTHCTGHSSFDMCITSARPN